MKTVTGKEIWSALTKDSDFMDQPDALIEAIRPFAEALPTILSNMMVQPANLNNIMQAKVLFLRYCVDHGFASQVAAAMPDDSLGIYDREELAPMLEEAISLAIGIAEGLVGNVSELMEAHGITEDQYMLSQEIGFTDDVAQMYREGQLTIGRLLVTQPGVIVKNS